MRSRARVASARHRINSQQTSIRQIPAVSRLKTELSRPLVHLSGQTVPGYWRPSAEDGQLRSQCHGFDLRGDSARDEEGQGVASALRKGRGLQESGILRNTHTRVHIHTLTHS